MLYSLNPVHFYKLFHKVHVAAKILFLHKDQHPTVSGSLASKTTYSSNASGRGVIPMEKQNSFSKKEKGGGWYLLSKEVLQLVRVSDKSMRHFFAGKRRERRDKFCFTQLGINAFIFRIMLLCTIDYI